MGRSSKVKYSNMDIQVEVVSVEGITTAIATVYGEDGSFMFEEVGVSRRHNRDKNDDLIGFQYATSRALAKVTKKIRVQADGKVKHTEDMQAQKVEQKRKTELKKKQKEAGRKAAETRKRNAALSSMSAPSGKKIASAKISPSTITAPVRIEEPAESLREL